MLTLLVLLSGLCYAIVAWFDQSLHVAQRNPNTLLFVLGLFAIAFVLYLFALRVVLQIPAGRRLLLGIVGPAVVFRLLLLFTSPIEEIDLYRYLWDGMATTVGVSPYRFAPDQVRLATISEDLPDDLQRLVAIRDQSPTMQIVLNRIHFADLPTIYPPVSQGVFAAAAWLVPLDASVEIRMIVMKSWFVLFDLATILVLASLLCRLELPLGWLLAYAWCPLVVKEIANSGHLDSLPAFLTAAAVSVAVANLWTRNEGRRRHVSLAAGAAILLGLGVGAKLYPVILAPLLIVTTWKRRGLAVAAISAICFLTTSIAVLWPMVPNEQYHQTEEIRPWSVDASEMPPLPPLEVDEEPRDPSQSVRAFLGQWEMNDFFFLLAIENLRPMAQLPKADRAWFSIVPETWRSRLIDPVARMLGVSPLQTAFIASRALLTIIFGAIVGWLCIHAVRHDDPQEFLEASFLTIAWFFLLSPTVNPWYWAWAMPLIPFARNRIWLILSGLLFVYYLRFWLAAFFQGRTVLGTEYRPELFFDYVVTWIEFVPWLIALALAAAVRQNRSRIQSTPAIDSK